MTKNLANIFIIPILLSILLVILRFNFNYLAFHSFAEYFAVFVSLGITLVSYYTYSFTKNRYLLFIGLGYFWVAILDMFHTQTYPGMPLYTLTSSNHTLSFWILNRILGASILLLAPFMRNINFNTIKVSIIFALISSGIIILSMNFPLELFVQGEGLTPLKITLEYLVIFILLLTIFINKKYESQFNKEIHFAVTLSIVLTIASEICFTLYSDFYGITNLLGHILKFISFWILLQAIIKNSLSKPFSMMQRGSSSYNTIPIPSIVVDDKGIIRQVNKAACDFISSDEANIIGQSNHKLFHPSNLSKNNCPICNAIKNNSFLKDFELKCDDGTYVEFSITPIQSSQNETKGVVQVSIDTTQKKKLQEKLLQQSKMAQMGEMISMIAHQWRQPLGAISATSIDLQMKLELEKFDFNTKKGIDEAKEYFLEDLSSIDNYVNTLSTTIDDFRNFYKTDKKTSSIKLHEIVEKSLNVIQVSLLNENIKIIKDYNDKKEIRLYDSEMMQVVLNILKNSQDNFKEKDIKDAYIKITTKDKFLTICDNGGGIDKNIINNIFDPYFSTKSEKNGTGLGLYMSKTIVEEHHKGSLYVENTKDGICFKIELND